MRTGAAEGHVGYFHEAAFYESDAEFLELVVPFLQDGMTAGEPTVVACTEELNRGLSREVDPSGITFLPSADQYARPGRTIRSYRKLFAELVEQGAEQIRVVGTVPHPGMGVEWYGWARYEAAVNYAYDEYPIWGLCAYDSRTAPDQVRDDVIRTHRHISDHEGHHDNDHFVDPATFLRTLPEPPIEPIERTEPALVLSGDSTNEARSAIRAACLGALSEAELNDLLLAATEAIANAHMHGTGPVTVRLWVDGARVVVTVSDRGEGPNDPLAGLLPPRPDAISGRGLWIANQLCGEITLHRNDGYHVRMTMVSEGSTLTT